MTEPKLPERATPRPLTNKTIPDVGNETTVLQRRGRAGRRL